MQTVRIIVVDAYAMWRDGLCHLLGGEPGFEVVGVADSGADAVRLVDDLGPDVMLIDIQLGAESGVEVLRALHSGRSTVRPVVLTASADKNKILEAILLGARGLVLKESPTIQLFKCIRSVMAGEYWFGHDRLPDLIEALQRFGQGRRTPTPAETLTHREILVVSALADGASNRDISSQLGLSEQTVKNQLSHIYDKVGVSNRLELALFALHHKLTERAN